MIYTIIIIIIKKYGLFFQITADNVFLYSF